MRPLIALFFLASIALADEATLDQLKAQIAALQAQLAMAQQNLEICASPEVMRVRLAAFDAMKRAEKPKEPPKPDADKP